MVYAKVKCSKIGYGNSIKGISIQKFESEVNKRGILKRLEMGNMMMKFSSKKTKPEQRTFQVKMETRELIWSRQIQEGSIDICEIKEIREGKVSKDFDKMHDETRKVDSTLCFSILYGNEFNLKVISIAAQKPNERDVWVKGLSYLVVESLQSSYLVQEHRWLLKEFSQIARKNTKKNEEIEDFRISLSQIKKWLPNANLKINPTTELMKIFSELDSPKKGDIPFDQFESLYQNILFASQKSLYSLVQSYSHDNSTFTPYDVQKFLLIEQKEEWSNDLEEVKKRMFDYIGDESRKIEHIYFNAHQMLGYLFSQDNSIWNEKVHVHRKEDYNHPLSHYWISSSHNTYLTGDQIMSESSCEAYARALRMGCRCVELDTWDGPEGMPVITHGLTMTTKIRFIDVLKTIRDHAFVTSDFPVILSIENHCHLPQQRQMATAFKDIFGDMLLTEAIVTDTNVLPSPNQLKNKIILKHKKLDEANRQTEELTESRDFGSDHQKAIKSGMMYLEDKTFKEWNSHYFALTDDYKLVFTEEKPTDKETLETLDVDIKDQHFRENWFHGSLSRQEAESELKNFSSVDGAFLVRDSNTFIGNYTLSFMLKGKVNHCRVRQPQSSTGDTTKYFLQSETTFPNLHSLITHYMTNPLRHPNLGVDLLLTESVPQRNAHKNKEWYHENMSRQEAEQILSKCQRNGVYLVRSSFNVGTTSYAISFGAEGKVKHCKINVEGRLFMIGNASFLSICDIITFYKEHPLYRQIKLKYSCTRARMNAVKNHWQQSVVDMSGVGSYVRINRRKLRVRALYDYNAQREDEMSFCKHAIIENVEKWDGGWWMGWLVGAKQKMWFPSNYVEEIDDGEEVEMCDTNEGTQKSAQNFSVLGEMQLGEIDLLGTCGGNITVH